MVRVKDKQVRVQQNSLKKTPVFIKITGTDEHSFTLCADHSPTALLALSDLTGSLSDQ